MWRRIKEISRCRTDDQVFRDSTGNPSYHQGYHRNPSRLAKMNYKLALSGVIISKLLYYLRLKHFDVCFLDLFDFYSSENVLMLTKNFFSIANNLSLLLAFEKLLFCVYKTFILQWRERNLKEQRTHIHVVIYNQPFDK